MESRKRGNEKDAREMKGRVIKVGRRQRKEKIHRKEEEAMKSQ